MKRYLFTISLVVLSIPMGSIVAQQKPPCPQGQAYGTLYVSAPKALPPICVGGFWNTVVQVQSIFKCGAGSICGVCDQGTIVTTITRTTAICTVGSPQ